MPSPRAAVTGALLISEPVYAELAAHFREQQPRDRLLADTCIRLEPSGGEAPHRAGTAWSKDLRRRPATPACRQCGAAQDVRCEKCGAGIQPRQHVLADFLIGAHALVHADRLLTRDRGYFATYFADLALE